MNADIEKVISLYKEQIEAYERQADDLKQRYRDCDNKNAALIGKVRELEDVIEKANVANRDLNLAFEHVHQENIRIQMQQGTNQEVLAISNPNKQLQITENDSKKEQLASESLVWMSERDQYKQRNKFLERECERYHRDNIHLGKQVRHLLKTLEEERGMIVRHQSQVMLDKQVACAADVIDKHLITFESIEELQQQNQKLLSLVKNLSAEQEEREVRVESDEVKRLTADLEELKSQLETIKSDRDRVIEALTTIHKERDLFKILLCKTRQVEHMTPEIFQRMVAVACSSGPAIADTQATSAEREAHIDDLKKMISTLEQDLTTLKSKLEDSQATSAIDLKLKNELLEKAHIKISEIMKSQEAMVERNQVLETNIQALTTEFDEIRTKCQKMTFELEEANKKKDDAEGLNRELKASLETERKRCQDALIEVSQVREQSQQLLESLEREKKSRQQELASLFSDIQQRQMCELEEKTRKQVELEFKLSNSERDIQTLRLQMEEIIKEKQAASVHIAELERRSSGPTGDPAAEASIRELESQIHIADARIKELETQIQAAHAQIRELESQIQAAEARIKELDSQNHADQAKINELGVKYLEMQQGLGVLQEQRNLEREGRLKLERECRIKHERDGRVKHDRCFKTRPLRGSKTKVDQIYEEVVTEVQELEPALPVTEDIPVTEDLHPTKEDQPIVTQIKLKRRNYS